MCDRAEDEDEDSGRGRISVVVLLRPLADETLLDEERALWRRDDDEYLAEPRSQAARRSTGLGQRTRPREEEEEETAARRAASDDDEAMSELTALLVLLVDDVLARQPGLTPALSLRGRLALNANRPEEAEPYLRQTIDQEPSNYRTLYSLIQCLRQNGKAEEAERRQKDLLQLEKDLARFNDIATKEMLQRPRDPDLHCELGRLLLRGGHREEGLHWLQSALRIDPNYAPARQALAEYYQKVPAGTQSRD